MVPPYLLLVAARVAKSDDSRNYRHGCVIKRSDGAIVVARNHSIQGKPTYSAHAEARALRKADSGSTLYVARVLKNGEWANSRPCERCRALIRNMRVRKVVFTLGPGIYGIWYPHSNAQNYRMTG